MVGWAALREVPRHLHARGQPPDDAVLVPRLLRLLQCPDRNPAGVFQHPPAQVGHHRPSLPDQPAVGFPHAVAPGLNVSQKTAWFMLHRIREAWMPQVDPDTPYDGLIEVDETYMRVEFLLLATWPECRRTLGAAYNDHTVCRRRSCRHDQCNRPSCERHEIPAPPA